MDLTYRHFLKQILSIKQSKNPAYTIGSLGRTVGLSTSRMGQILNGKVGISIPRAHAISEALQLSEYDKKLFVLLVQAEHDRSPVKRNEALIKIKSLNDNFQNMDDFFHSICDWYHHAILEFIALSETGANIQDISKKLGLDINLVTEAINRLLTLELISQHKELPTHFVPNSENRRTSQDTPTEAVKVLNEQILEKAAYELRHQDVKNRDFSIVFFKFNKKQMELAKEKIMNFRREMLKEFDTSPGKDSVYCMGIQFFELTGKELND